MSSASIQLIALPPDPSEVLALITKFSSEMGTITAFDDVRIALVRDLGYDDSKCELVAFGDLMGRALLEMGGRPAALPTRGQTRAAIRLACEGLPESSAFYACRSFAGFHDSLADTLKELHHWGIDAAALDLAAQAADGPLKSRLEALLAVERSEIETMERIGRVPSSRRAEALIELPPGESPHFKRLLVLAGSDFYPVELRALKKLSEIGVAVTVAVDWSPQGFAGTNEITLALGQSQKPPRKAIWTNALFGMTPAKNGPEVVIFSAADSLSECEWALRLCQQEHSEQGVPEHRIVICATDPDHQIPLLVASAKRLGIGLNAPMPMPLLSNGFATLICKLLEMLASDNLYRLPAVATSTYLRSDHAVRRTMLDEALDWQSRQLEPWAELSLFANEKREELPWLWPMLLWRERACAAQRTLSEWHAMLEEFMHLEVLEAAAQDSTSSKREYDARAHTGLLRALADFAPSYDSRHGKNLTFSQFVAVANSLWRDETIMQSNERRGFRVVSDPLRIGVADVVVALGMLEGTIPRRRTEDAILGDEDRHALHGLLPHFPPLHDSFFEARAQRDRLVRICASARKKLILSYAQTEGDRDNVPTSYLHEIERALPRKVHKRDFPHRLVVPDLDECRFAEDLAIRKALDDPQRDRLTAGLESEDAKSMIRPDFAQGVRIAELKEALECPFQSAAHHRLNLRARKLELERKLRRLPIRAGILSAPTPEAVRNALCAERDTMIAEEAPYRKEWEMRLLEAGADRMIDAWVNSQTNVLAVWKPKDAAMGVELGSASIGNGIRLQGRAVVFLGTVDGLSQIGGYKTIHYFRDVKVDELTDADRMMMGVHYQLLSGKTEAKIAFEFASPKGRKLVHLEDGKVAGVFSKSGSGLTYASLGLDAATLTKVANQQIAAAGKILNSAKMKATPGEHCRHCDLGELCRSSQIYIPIDDILVQEQNDGPR